VFQKEVLGKFSPPSPRHKTLGTILNKHYLNMSNSENQVSNTLIALREINISLLKTKINLIFPFGGGIINEFLFDLYGRIKQERVNRFVDVLGDKFEKLESSVVSREYLQSEEFLDLILKVFEVASKSNIDIKRKFLANILVDSVTSRLLNNEISILFSEFIETMTTNQINILVFIQNNSEALVEIGSYEKYFEMFTKAFPDSRLDKYEFKYYSFGLEAKSLISTGAGLNNFDDTSSTMAFQNHKEASVFLTTLGEKFIKYIEE